jgi:hypothetical protein
MNPYYAKFRKRENVLTRELTRIYFKPVDPVESDNECIGVVIAKNPGAAIYKQLNVWTEINLDNDNMLPILFNTFNETISKINYQPPKNAYIRILNLFPVCNVDVDIAYKDLLKISDNIIIEDAESDLKVSRFIFIAWGNEPYLDPFRTKWIEILKPYSEKSFYFSYETNERYKYYPEDGVPLCGMNVKHPILLTKNLIIDKILKYF